MIPFSWSLMELPDGFSIDWTGISILAATFFLAIILAFLVATLVPVYHIASYVHAVTYVHARRVPFVRREDLLGLLEIRDPETIASTLRARCSVEIEASMSVEEWERQLHLWHAREVDALAQVSPSGIHPFLEALQLRFEIDAIRGAILRKHSRKGVEEMLAEVVPYGRIDRRMLQRMAEAPGIEGLIEALSATPYSAVLEGAFQEYSGRWQVTVLLIALERYFYRELRNAITRCERMVEIPLQLYLETRVDLTNIAAALSAKTNGVEPAEAKAALLRDGGALPSNLLERIIDASTPAEALMLLKETPYARFAESIGDAISEEGEGGGALLAILHALDIYWLEFAEVVGSRTPLSAGPILEYLIELETTRKNLQILLAGIAASMSRDRIEGLLVTKGVVP